MDHKTTECRCGSGEPRYELLDAAGIFCTFVCSRCEATRMKEFKPAIFSETGRYASTGDEQDIDIDDDYEEEDEIADFDAETEAMLIAELRGEILRLQAIIAAQNKTIDHLTGTEPEIQ